MGYKTVFKDVMREYEADRSRADALLEARRAEVYEKLPRLKEIDSALTETCLKLLRQALSGGEQVIAALREDSAILRAERDYLLNENGVSAGYFTDIYRCAACADTGYIERASAPPERCQCLKQRLIEKYYDLSNLKDVLAAENFTAYKANYYSRDIYPGEGISPYTNMRAIHKKVKQFTQQFGRQFANLLLTGETGLGKTFLCNCIAKDILDEGHTVLYVTAPRFFKLVEDSRFNRGELDEPDEMLDAAGDVDLLILDDLGTEFATVITSAALFDLINQRLLMRKPTVISTNLSPAGLEAQYSERIVSRLRGYYDMFKFFGDDIRVKKRFELNK